MFLGFKFILGPAGAGKTTHCLNALREKIAAEPDGLPIILLVPEQTALQLERELALSAGVAGLMRVHVLSFRRLAWRVFRDVGGATRTHIGELGKKMVFKKLLEEHKDELNVFAHASQQIGFLDTLAEMISEAKRYLLTPEQLSASIDVFNLRGQKLLSGKLHDISMLYSEFDMFLSDKFIDPDDYLTLLADKLPKAQIIKKAELWIDGFAGFIPQEYLVLEALFRECGQISIALCLNPERLAQPLDEEPCFHTTRETYLRLIKLCEKTDVAIEPAVILPADERNVPHRFINSPDIAHLERYLYITPEKAFIQEVKNIKLAAAADRRTEVEWMAREILLLSKKRGYRWKDIAVILRDFEGYRELIVTVFNEMGIAYFIDQKRNIWHHPLIELLLSCIQIIIEEWSYEPLFRCLKTDFFALSRDQVDQLENYVIMHGISGRAWTDKQDWTYRRRGNLGEGNEVLIWETEELQNINNIKQSVQGQLLGFYFAFKKASTVEEMTAIIYEFLEKLQVEMQLEQWQKISKDEGELEKAREHTQMFASVLRVLEEITETLGNQKTTVGEYFKMLEAGLYNIRLGLTSPSLDQVLVVALGHLGISNIKAGFLLGVNDGSFPKKAVTEGMLTEPEREQLMGIGIGLAPNEDMLLLDEEYLLYIGLTRASDYLCISYPLADQEGRALLPAMLIDKLQNIFPVIQKKLWFNEPLSGNEALDFLTTPMGSLPLLVNQLRLQKEGNNLHSMWVDLYNWYVENGDYKEKLQSVAIKGIFWVNQEHRLSSATSSKLFRNNLKTSVSRLEKFKQCPFAHFLNYGLRLKRRDSYKLEASDYGEFYHVALKNYFIYLQKNNLDPAELNEQEITKIMENVVGHLAPQLQNKMLISSKRYQYLTKKIQGILEKSAGVLTEHAKNSAMRSVALEISFGFADSSLPALKIQLGDKNLIELIGRIDRVDMVSFENNSYFAVIDYKSGEIKLKLDDIYYGLSLQLLAYMLVCLENSEFLGFKNAKPGGMLYFRVHNPILKWEASLSDEESIKKAFLKEFKMQGMVLADKELVQLMDKELLAGKSQMLRVAINKDGKFHKESAVFSEDNFIVLREYFKRLIRKVGGEILAGEIGIKPCVKGKKRACTFCPYNAVCQFDVLFAGNDYSFLKQYSNQEVWQMLTLSEGDDLFGTSD